MLKAKVVEVEGYGPVEIREPLFDDIEGMFFTDGTPQGKPTDLLRKCLFVPGTDKRVFDAGVGASLGMKLMRLAPEVMAFIGLGIDKAEDGEEKKD